MEVRLWCEGRVVWEGTTKVMHLFLPLTLTGFFWFLLVSSLRKVFIISKINFYCPSGKIAPQVREGNLPNPS